MHQIGLIVIFFTLCIYPIPSLASHLIEIAAVKKNSIEYEIAGNLCRIANQSLFKQGVQCTTFASENFQENIERLQAGQAQFALIPSDFQNNAFNGLADLSNLGEFTDIRSVFSLYQQYFSIFVTKTSKINDFKDLKGKRINIGQRNSTEQRIMKKMLAAQGWNRHNFTRVFELNSQEQINALCTDVIENILFISPTPKKIADAAAKQCDIKPIIIENDYRLRSTLVTTTAVAQDKVYSFTAAIFSHIDKLRKSHSALGKLSVFEMATEELFAPVHPGAEQYYQEIGVTIMD